MGRILLCRFFVLILTIFTAVPRPAAAADAPHLRDGEFVSAPNSGVWSPDGHWIAEKFGVLPDVEAELDPKLVREGKDPQLEKTVEIILDELSKKPLPKPKRPSYPDYHKKK